MTIADIYLSGDQKRNISHFANIVKIAKSDGEISNEEEELLKAIAKKYQITDDNFKAIFKDPEYYPIRAQLGCEERIERLFDLLKMVFADHKMRSMEVSTLRKIVIGLAFSLKNVDDIVIQAVHIDIENCSLEEFQKEIMKVNRI
ncbi:MAG: hypothetical protein KAH67_02685 [Flavobacteriaceae bacterium]|nr:hypothetical protein [Flavobacteriaceae bacterium]